MKSSYYLAGACLSVLCAASQADILVGYDFDNGSGSGSQAPNVIAHKLTASGFDTGSGLISNVYTTFAPLDGLDAEGNAFGTTNSFSFGGAQSQFGFVDMNNADNLTSALSANDYMTFTVTPESLHRMNLESFTFRTYAKELNNAAERWALFSSVDGFTQGDQITTGQTADILTWDGVTNNIIADLSDSRFQNLTEAVEFRLYVYGGDGSANSATAVDKVILNGSTQNSILVAYDFDANSAAPSAATLEESNVSGSDLSSPMDISFAPGFGDSTGTDAHDLEFGSSSVLGAVAIQVIDATRSSFDLAVQSNNYVSFTITPDSGFMAELSSISFKAAKKHNNSVDEFAIADAQGNMLGSAFIVETNSDLVSAYQGFSIDLTNTDLQRISEPTELRIYAWGRGSNNTSNTAAAIDKITVYGKTIQLGSDYYVATNGSDTNSGGLGQPFASVQHALNFAKPGSTIYLRGGSYHESVNLSGIAGLPGYPITIMPYNGENVIFDGTAPITTNWRLDSSEEIVLPAGNDTPLENIPGMGNVYVTTLDDSIADVTQLFVDGDIMTLARFPNALVWSDDFWTQRTMKQSGSERGYIVGTDIIADAGVSFKGCSMLYNFENYGSAVSLVQAHSAGDNVFSYGHRGGWRHSNAYFFEGGLGNAERVMLDMAQEWAYDETTRKLYLWADDGQDPTGRKVAGKVQTYAITGDATTQNIVLDGLDFFATTWKFSHSDGIMIQNTTNDYPSCSRRALGGNGEPSASYLQGDKNDFCEDITIYNNVFRRSDGAALMTAYTENMLVENNLFEQANYTCLAGKAVQLAGARNLVARRNTLRDSGTSSGFSIGRWYKDPTGVNPYVFEHNVATGCSRMQIDGTAFYAVGGNAQESVTRYNWGYGNRQRDFRWDGNNTPLIGIYGNSYRNVCLNSVNKTSNLIGGAYKLKGDFHEIYNNIAIDLDGRVKGQFEISVGNGGNKNTHSFNNAGDYLSGTNEDGDVPGIIGNNFIGQRNPRTMSLLLRNPADLDFRPRWDAVELIDQAIEVTCTYNNGDTADVTAGFNGQAPDIGAYEYGEDHYWIPGYQYPQASTPIPSNGNVVAKIDTDLIWLGGLGSVSYNIYLGSSANDLAFVGNQTNNVYKPSSWTNDQAYFWRIDSVLEDGSVVTGDVWTFTINDHAPRAHSQRMDAVEETPIAITLGGSDPDGSSLAYRVTALPQNGTLSGTAPNLVYTPNTNFFGTDSFLFTTNDGTEDSTAGIVIVDVSGVENDAPQFTLDTLTTIQASIISAYTASIAGSASDPDVSELSYSIVEGPSWLNITADGELNGTPSFSDLGTNSWTVQVEDPTGLTATATLEIRVYEGDILEIDFADLNSSLDTNSLMSGGSAENVTVSGVASGNDYLYTVVYAGRDLDGDLSNDTLSFDVRVKGWNGSATDTGLSSDGKTYAASATIGSNRAAIFFNGTRFSIIDAKMNNGETLEFIIENVQTSLSDASKTPILHASTFASARLEQTSTTGNSHQVVFGEGSDLYGAQFAYNLESGALDVGDGSLYISSDAGGGTRSTSWAVGNVDFDINILVVPANGYTTWAANYGIGSVDPRLDSDGDGLTNLEEYQTGLNPIVNVAPEADLKTPSVNEDGSIGITLSGSDTEGASLSFNIESYPTNGQLSGSVPNLIYTPHTNYNGSDVFTYTVNDGSLDSNIASVTLTVLPINDAPNVNNPPETSSILVDQAYSGSLADSSSDADGDSLSYTIASGPSWLSIASDGTLSGMPSTSDAGLNIWEIEVSDGKGGTQIINLEIIVSMPILIGYDFDSDAADPSQPTVFAPNLSASQFTSPMVISYGTSYGDNTGTDAAGIQMGNTSLLGAIGVQVIDATNSSFAGAVAGDDYLTFTVTPSVGSGFQLSSIAFKASKKHVNSVDEYAITDASGNLIGGPVAITNVIGLTGAYDGVIVDLSGSDMEYISEPTEFRIYIWGRGTSSASNTLAAVDKVTLHGSSYVAPVAYWALDDGSSGTALDSSGNGYDGTVANAISAAGVDGTALDFNGSSSEIILPATAFQSIDQQITLSMWVYGAANQPRSDTIFSAKDASGNRVLNIHLPWGNSNVYWDAGWDSGYDRIFYAASANQYQGAWNHWVFVKNATSGMMAIYHNGSLFHSQSGLFKSMSGISSAALGSELGTSHYAGSIDDVFLFDVALTAQEVADLYNSY